MFFVYVLRSEPTGRYYTGCTKDVEVRVAQHNAGMTKATRPFRPWQIVHVEAFETLVQARRREVQIKSWKSKAYMRDNLKL